MLLLRHKDFASVLPQEKKKAKATVKEVMAKTEELKEVLRVRFSAEHEVWLRVEKRRQEEEEVRAIEERKRAEEEGRFKAAEAASIERDRQVVFDFFEEPLLENLSPGGDLASSSAGCRGARVASSSSTFF